MTTTPVKTDATPAVTCDTAPLVRARAILAALSQLQPIGGELHLRDQVPGTQLSPASAQSSVQGSLPVSVQATSSSNQFGAIGPVMPNTAMPNTAMPNFSPGVTGTGTFTGVTPAHTGDQLNFTDTDRDVYREVIRAVDPVRGRAVVAVADHLHRQRITVSYAKALLLSVDLLGHESPETCLTLSTLLDDGWEQGLGDALTAARNL